MSKQKDWSLRTFDEWSNAGYKINKGEKAVGRNLDGTPVFSRHQVTQKTYSAYDDSYDDSDLTFEETQTLGFWG